MTPTCSARMLRASLSALLLCCALGAAKPAPRPAAPTVTDSPDPLIAEVAASLEASSVNRVSLDRYALAGLDMLADADKCLGRKGEGQQIALVCGDVQARAPWPPRSATEVAALLSTAARLVDPAHAVTQERARRVARALARAVDDPFTAYLSPEIVATMTSHATAAFQATPGIEVWPRDPTRIREVRRGSDAAREGVHVEDRLVAIDGVATDKLSLPEIQVLLSGANDSVARVTVRGRAGRRELMVARTLVPEGDVVHKILGGGVLYIWVPSFKQGMAAHLGKILRDATSAGIILDLRHNGGGLIPEGIAVADLFLRDGAIGGVRSGPGRASEDFVAHRDAIDATEPLVLLIDGGSASASELVAMVLKERGRAQLLGGTTAGKGSVQRQIHLPDDGVLKVTAGYYVGPSGTRLDDGGVQPHRFLAPSQRNSVLEGALPSEDSWVLSALDALQNADAGSPLFFERGSQTGPRP